MRNFRIKSKCGNHSEGGRMYKAGDIVTSDKDLVRMFPFKFEEVTVAPGAPASAAAPVLPQVAVPAAPAPTPAAPLGRDVSKRFPKVEEQDFKVFAVQGGFNVYDVDALDKPINPAVLLKKDVEQFVEKYLKGV